MKIFMKIMRKKYGFTLPEVLVALLILGVLAAFTIPMINYSYKRLAIQAAFSNTVKEFNNGITNYLAESSGVRRVEADGTDNLVLPSMINVGQAMVTLFSDENPAQRLSSQFKAIKVGTNCWNNATIHNNFDGSGGITNLNGLNCFVGGDNITYAIEILSNDCSENLYNGGANNRHKLRNSCAILYFDLNGEKAPNSFGHDVFAFIITEASNNYLYPVGGSLMATLNAGALNGVQAWKSGAGTCNNNNKDGRACAGRVMEENGKIRYWR